MPAKIKLVETRRGCAVMERTPRYDVVKDGNTVGQLYYNMTGYVGTLPLPDGSNMSFPERGISQWRKWAAEINRGELS
jgi:hypothetical protein